MILLFSVRVFVCFIVGLCLWFGIWVWFGVLEVLRVYLFVGIVLV